MFESGGFNQNSFEGEAESREPEGFPDLDKVLEKAEETVFSLAIDPQEFAEPQGHYRKEAVEADMAYVEERERGFEKSDREGGTLGNKSRQEALRKIARGFEAVILQSDANDWFGPNAEMIIPSRYDDIKNGVDGIVEFNENESYSHLVLAVDMVSSNNTETIGKKLENIKGDIQRNNLAKIKYFESEQLNIKGEKTNIPRVVIGADRKTVHGLLTLFAEGKNKDLAGHYMQMQMLKEIQMQLDSFSKFADTQNKPELVKAYDSAKITIDRIIDEKVESIGERKVGKMEDEMNKDIAYTYIKSRM